MSEGTTNPNGSREMRVKETNDVEKRIEAAEYNYKINALQAQFSKDKVQEGEGNNSGSSDSARPTKAGDHTIASNKATIAFKPLIPFIAAGAKAKLKGKGKEDKSIKNQAKDREDK